MLKWSVLKDSIPEFMASTEKDNLFSTVFLRYEIEFMLSELSSISSPESLYQLLCMRREWKSPSVNRILFSGLNHLRDRFGDFYIDMLITEFSSSAYIPQINWQRKEVEYSGLLADGIEDIFPEFTGFKQEVIFEGFRVDLLAKVPTSERYVLFELKTGVDDPTPQLLRYSKHFNDPILIGLTEKSLPRHRECDQVYYFTYDMLNRRATANICRKFSKRNVPFNLSPTKFDLHFRTNKA